jgi:hypothetical protein
MTTRSYRKNARQRQCHTHRGYLAANCPLCTQALKAFLDRELPRVSTFASESRHAGTTHLASRRSVSDGRDPERRVRT